MQVYNLLQYNDNYSMASESLWNCYIDELNDDLMNIILISIE